MRAVPGDLRRLPGRTAGSRGTADPVSLGSRYSRAMRARDLGIRIGLGTPGPHNAITDVAGVTVGHTTLISGDGPLVVGQGPVRTGVTVVCPRGGARREPVFAGCHRLNGNGELTGLEWVRESGLLTTPVAITNTHSVGVVRDALVAASVDARWATRRWSLPVVGETYDGVLNDINGFHVTGRAPPRGARGGHGGPVEEGAVGGGTGMVCHEFKGGIGTASRVLRRDGRRLHGRGARPGELRQARLAAHRRRPGRRGDPDLRGARVRGRPSGRDAPAEARARSSSSSRPTRRCSPTSASGSPSARVSGSPASAAPAVTRAATCSSRSRPATACRPGRRRGRRRRARDVRRPGRRRRRHRPAVRRGDRGDRGGDRQRARRGDRRWSVETASRRMPSRTTGCVEVMRPPGDEDPPGDRPTSRRSRRSSRQR